MSFQDHALGVAHLASAGLGGDATTLLPARLQAISEPISEPSATMAWQRPAITTAHCGDNVISIYFDKESLLALSTNTAQSSFFS